MKLWDIIKIVSAILLVKFGCRTIDAVYVYLTDDRTRKAVFDDFKNDKWKTSDAEEIEEDTVIMGFQA